MDSETTKFGLTAFVTLVVIVDPFSVVPIFAGLTSGLSGAERKQVLNRAIVTALSIALLFFIAGRATLAYMGVTIHAFSISGGILLFLVAMPMLFGQRGGLQAPEQAETSSSGMDVAIFPLAIPLLAGPGMLTSILLLTSQASGNKVWLGLLTASIFLVFIISWIVLRIGDWVLARIGNGGVHVATRVLGIVLAALAIQFVLNGITGYFTSIWKMR